MFNRKNIITVVLLLALVVVIVLATTNRSRHGDKAQWMKTHGEVTKRNPDPGKFCIRCHTEERGETEENYCNVCHSINKQHQNKDKWFKEHGVVAARYSSAELGKFCLDCHGKTRDQVKEGFCNECHKKSNTPLTK